MPKYTLAFVFIVTVLLPVFCYGELPDDGGETVTGSIDTSRFDDAEPVFSVGIIMNAGTYYEPQGDTYVAKELPDPGGLGAALAHTNSAWGSGEPDYYFVQGRGWEGWVDERHFEIPRVPLSGEINTAKLNVRSGPTTKSEVLGQVVEGDRVYIYERSGENVTIGDDSGYWYRIGEEEWVFGAYVNLLSTYDLLWLLPDPGTNTSTISPEAVGAVINGIINAPQRPFEFEMPPEWEDVRPPVDPENSTYQSQALYWASLRLLNVPGEDAGKWAAFYAEQLGEYYPDNKVYDRAFGFERAASAEASRIRLKAYAALNDRGRFEEVITRAFPQYGTLEFYSFEYGSLYGFEMLFDTHDYVSDWEPGEAADLFLDLAEIAPNRLLTAYAEFVAGETLVKSEDEADVARGQNILWAVVEEYPDPEHNFFYVTYNPAQAALVEYVRSLPDDERRRSFLTKYAGDATPFPVRYQALYLLAYGDEGYDRNPQFGPLDTGYRELYDSIQLEDKEYWFTWR
jgi:hypothetical protein